uniref:Variant surface glycoprotein 1125.1183 n=1 Tax=Trypanosoma brucei TaxID=5691 RepID=M4SVR8_9TRYP|nr:variant surface glycoprotein 1191 [Trypanosoma brucei]APD73429.1 variant surface glycoprotein 1125.1183 [Trypanosoma brucei]
MTGKVGANSILADLVTQLAVPELAAAAPKMGLKQSVWKPLCDLSEELDSRPSNALKQITDAKAAIQKQTIAAKQAEIYAAPRDGTTLAAAAAAVAAAHYNTKVNQGLTRLKTATAKEATQNAGSTAYLKVLIDEWLNIMVQNKQAGNHGCLLNANGDDTAPGSTGQIDGQRCKLKLSLVQEHNDTTAELTQLGFPKLLTKLGSADADQDDNYQCALTSGHSTSGMGTAAALSGAVKFIDGYIVAPVSASPLTITDLSIIDSSKATDHPAWHAAWAAAKDKKGANDAAYQNSTGDITNKDGVSELVKLVYLQKADAEATEVQNELAKYFGKHTEDKWKELNKKIHDFEIPEKVAGLRAQTKVGEITDTPKLLAILAYYQLQGTNKLLKLKEDLEAEKAKHASSAKIEPENVCNEIGDKNETVCAKTPGCHFVSTNSEGKNSTLTKETEKKQENKQGISKTRMKR